MDEEERLPTVSDPQDELGFHGLGSVQAACPWCGEDLEWVLDPSNTATYVEDCYVCCRPCLVTPQVGDDGCVQGVSIDCE